MTREQAINYLISSGFSEEQVSEVVRALTYKPTTKKELGVDCIDRAELLKAMDTWDKFGYTETGCFVREPKGGHVLYVKYDDMVNCVKGMPSVTPQEPCDKCEVGNPCLYCKHEFIRNLKGENT